MYKYDQYDQAMVDARVEEFRDQARRRLEGKLTEDQFKPLRLMNGLYLQLHAYMLRVAIPYGTLDARQMEMLADIADKYDRGYGHFTTRQNIQYNWIKLEDCADALADLATVEMHAIQTSGNCIRNISSDHFAGAAADVRGPMQSLRAAGTACAQPTRHDRARGTTGGVRSPQRRRRCHRATGSRGCRRAWGWRSHCLRALR